jgi:hypothetical protein
MRTQAPELFASDWFNTGEEITPAKPRVKGVVILALSIAAS